MLSISTGNLKHFLYFINHAYQTQISHVILKSKTTSKVLLSCTHYTEQSKSIQPPLFLHDHSLTAKCHNPPASQGTCLLLWLPAQAAHLYPPGEQKTYHIPQQLSSTCGPPFQVGNKLFKLETQTSQTPRVMPTPSKTHTQAQLSFKEIHF